MTTTGRRPGTPAAERKRQQRAREKTQLVFQTEDWQQFMDLATLPQKAGCQPQDLRKIVLKEIVDNALDAGAKVTLENVAGVWTISDDGPGIDPFRVAKLFCVDRPLVSTKLLRLPLRGMLGNGLRVVAGAVAATEGSLVVETRGHKLTLNVSPQTGATSVVCDDLVAKRPGVRVHIFMGPAEADDDCLARTSITAAGCSKSYEGPSSPWWYGAADLHRLFLRIDPKDTTVDTFCKSFGLNVEDNRVARALSRDETEEILDKLRASIKPVSPDMLGGIGRDFCAGWAGYARGTNTTITQSGAHIPYVVEAWAACSRSGRKGQGTVDIQLLINQSATEATIHASSKPGGLFLHGCGLYRSVNSPSTADYQIKVSVISPYVQLATDGKEPSLMPFSQAIATVVSKACCMAHRAMGRPERGATIKEVAWALMDQAYQKASGNEKYPANARQIMYAARPDILDITGMDSLDDAYFTQNLLPDYIVEHGKFNWDVVYDSRGSLIEPHTGTEAALGTIEVRQYLSKSPSIGSPISFAPKILYPTAGPEHRYSSVLFIEKEGFTQLIKQARIAERFDVAIMSTKGMSTTAARTLLDQLSPRIEKVLVLHDFDVAGFSIFGTLASDGRRYTFANKVSIVDLGLRLADIESLGLQSESVKISGTWASRSRTLAEHGARRKEIDFLRTRRVELNAMTSDVFVAFIERKLLQQGVRKMVPDKEVLAAHAVRIRQQELASALLARNQSDIRAAAMTIRIPKDFDRKVRSLLEQQPALSWDQAVTEIVAQKA